MAVTKIREEQMSFRDVTTGNVSSSAHGLAPKNPGDATKFLNGSGTYTKPTGTSLGLILALQSYKMR